MFGELRFAPATTLRFGKFKTPLALEYLQSSSALALVERGLPAEVGAGRDFGVQLHGQTSGGAVSYAIAWVNGAPDGRDAGSSDTDSHKELAARLFFEPVRNLGFGVAATTGRKAGTSSRQLTNASATNTKNNVLNAAL